MANEALKSAIDEAFDLEALVKDSISKNWGGLLGDLVKAGTDIPGLIQKAKDLVPDLEVLMKDPSSDADLLAYVQAKIGGEAPAAQKVIVAVCDLLMSLAQVEPKVLALIDAIKGVNAPVSGAV